jgi:Trk K+ transport system NAD-binding subunit
MKVVIIGCGLVGMEAARHLKRAGHEVTGTTTRESRVEELSRELDHVAVLRGSDSGALTGLLEDKDVVIVTVSGGMFAQAGKGTVRAPELYKSVYIDTAAALNEVLAANRTVKQVIYTSAETVYAGIDNGPIVETIELREHQSDPATAIFVETERSRCADTPTGPERLYPPPGYRVRTPVQHGAHDRSCPQGTRAVLGRLCSDLRPRT